MSSLTVLEYNGQVIQQRGIDGYVNATQMCQANGKQIGDWLKTQDAKRYIDAISTVTNILASDLVKKIKPDVNKGIGGGTWIHPKLAIKLARWISVDFELWCDDHIKELIETGSTKISQHDADWTEARIEGKEIRLSLTDAIKAYLERHPELSEGKKKYLYAQASDTLNVNMLGKTSKELKALLGLTKSQLLRDKLSRKENIYLGAIELLACRFIDVEDLDPCEAVKKAINSGHMNQIFAQKYLSGDNE